MLYSAAAVKRWLGLVVSLSLVVGFVATGTSVYAASTSGSTQVHTLVCGAGSGATITIDQPASDSVVSQPVLTMSGEVSNATQIDVSIDGAYNSTVPLDAQQTTYQFDVSLSQGTHTIDLVANDVCQTQDASASVVVTYQPQTAPGDGNSTSTSSGGVMVGGPSSSAPTSNQPQSLSRIPIIGPVFNFFGWLGHALDFDTSVSQVGLELNILRFLMIIFGMLLLVFASAVFEFIMIVPWFKRFRGRRINSLSHWHGWHGWLLRAIGLGLFLAAFVI